MSIFQNIAGFFKNGNTPPGNANPLAFADSVSTLSSVGDNARATGIYTGEYFRRLWKSISGSGEGAGNLLQRTAKIAGHLIVDPIRHAARFAAKHHIVMTVIIAVGAVVGYKSYQNRKDAREAAALKQETNMLLADTAELHGMQQNAMYGQNNLYSEAHPAFNAPEGKWNEFAENRKTQVQQSLQADRAGMVLGS